MAKNRVRLFGRVRARLAIQSAGTHAGNVAHGVFPGSVVVSPTLTVKDAQILGDWKSTLRPQLLQCIPVPGSRAVLQNCDGS